MALFFDSLTATGGSDDDFIFGTPAGGANNSLSGGLGDDLIIGDLSGLFTTAGTSAANATDLTTDTGRWTTNENPDIANSTSVPHTTVHGTGNGLEHWYSFTVLGNETATIDIDYGDHDIGGSADFVIEIYDSTGNTLLDSNDNADSTDGGNGSTSDSDPFLQFTTGGASRFFIRIKTASGDTVPIGAEYILNVSITGQVATGTSTNGADSLFGGDGDDVLYGQGGADFIEGGDDDDTIEGGSGGDNLNGGDGIDTVSYASSNSTVIVRLDLGTASGGHAQGDIISNFENIIGSEFNDFLFGLNGADSTLIGGGGFDLLVGVGGTNLISGGEGNDSITVELTLGEDGSTLDGGSGIDTLFLFGNSSGSEDFRDDTIISIETLSFQAVPFDLSATFNAEQFAQFTTVAGFAPPPTVPTDPHERFVVIEMGDETELDLSGVTVTGFSGPDDGFLINGDSDAEEIIGTSVNDTFTGSGGADSIDGGAGMDTVTYADASAGVILFTSAPGGITGDAAGDSYANIERFIGSDFVDNIIGDGNSNTIEGGGANDVLIGNGGADSLFGGEGADILAGDDGGAGVVDLLDGGDGSDIAYYFNATSNQVVDIADHTNLANNSGEHTIDTWISISGFFGAKNFTNELNGDGQANELFGGDLGDTLSGNGNGDVLLGLGGNDTLLGGTGNDVLAGGAGTDTITGGTGGDVIYVQTNNGTDIVTDWVETEDFFLFYQTSVTSFAELTFTDTTPGAGGNVEVTSTADPTFTIVVENVEVTDLDDAGRYFFIA